MSTLDWTALIFTLTTLVVLLGGIAYLEHRGYCFSEHTCTAGYGVNRK